MKLHLSKNAKHPIYQQLVDQIVKMIKTGELTSGEKLPTERELTEEFNIAPGTVKTAYKTLAGMNKVFSVRGSGTYVIRSQPEIEMRQLRLMIDQVIHRASLMEISEKWIRSTVDAELKRYKASNPNVRVAWVSACWELLQMAETEMSAIPLVQLESFHLNQVLKNPAILDDVFDIIVTTEHYYNTLCDLIPDNRDKVYQTSLTMRQQSHYDLMRLDCNEPVTFCFFEDVFENIIRKRMAPYHNSDVFCSITGRTDFQNVSLNNRVLIVPEKSTLSLNKDMESFVRSAEQDGIHVIYIHYRLDRGSLLFLRSLICETWNLKYQNGFCDVNNSLDYHRKEYESDSVL